MDIRISNITKADRFPSDTLSGFILVERASAPLRHLQHLVSPKRTLQVVRFHLPSVRVAGPMAWRGLRRVALAQARWREVQHACQPICSILELQSSSEISSSIVPSRICRAAKSFARHLSCQASLPCPVGRHVAGLALGGVRGCGGECEMTQNYLFPERKPQEKWMLHSSSLPIGQ